MSWKNRLSIYKSKGQLRTEKYHRRLKKNSPKIETLSRHLSWKLPYTKYLSCFENMPLSGKRSAGVSQLKQHGRHHNKRYP